MAGGVYSDKPFHLNIKCVIASGMAIVFAHMIDHYGWSIMMDPILFIFVYIALASYDYFYDCEDKMQTGKYGPAGPFTTIMKPGQTPSDKTYHLRNVWIFHCFVLPVLIYISWRQITGGNVPEYMFGMIGGLASMGLIYHGAKLSHYFFM